jgi:hypothetical protein
MTGQQVFNAWNDPEITDIYEAAVFMAIADEADERGVSRPRIEDICRKARCKERSAENQIKSLVAKGKIKVTIRKGTSNEYQILVRTTCTPAPHAAPHDVHVLSAPNAPHTISALSTKNLNTNSITKPKEQKPKSRDPIHDSLVMVTKYPAGSFNGLVTSKLRKANPDKSQEWIASEILRRFGPNGLWPKNDWRGQQGQNPTPMQVLQEWDRVLIEKAPVNKGTTMADLRAQGYS